MDTRQLEYIIQISEERSITKAAEKLFVTQSALNQQLQKLENELGIALFVRNRSDWQLTPAGEIYVRTARQILNLKKDAYSQIEDLKESGSRRISLGLIPERGVNMFTAIYPEFHRTFPDTRIEPVECNVRTMQNLITKNELDLGLITLMQSQKDENTYLHMKDEEIFLAVPVSHALAHLGSCKSEDAPEISLSRFSADPFILITRRSTMYQLEEALFSQAVFQPQVLFSTSSNVSKYRMVLADVGCALLPEIFAQSDPGIRYFRLEGHPSWEVTMCCRKNAYLSHAEEYFLELCRAYWKHN
ncbi:MULTISPECIES: LysR family transcriptional regulator [unclassified Clostridium]|uniref:LysR family transcriptional regulator n=1 Tax=unclassified Clostridium TaxID=2614128 RepID=UPI000E4E6638|nr:MULTISPECIES: LysR family transcriptional regulator [unclassified Clostridium]RHP47336.1 LysR family transcriptional regulator [Clostridium sp. AF32-12BH]RHV65382.1 LysR family transcriptional regulator [Clostridium sp. OM02-18AC]